MLAQAAASTTVERGEQITTILALGTSYVAPFGVSTNVKIPESLASCRTASEVSVPMIRCSGYLTLSARAGEPPINPKPTITVDTLQPLFELNFREAKCVASSSMPQTAA